MRLVQTVDPELVYQRLPIPLQHAACSWQGWRIERSRFGRDFPQAIAEAERRSLWPRERAFAFRDERLRRFVAHLATTSPFYRRRFAEAGVDPYEIATLADLERLPTLTKEEVQDHYAELLSEAVPEAARQIHHTSGTTGGGLRFATTTEALREQWAVWWRYWRWHGIERGTWCGYFVGRSIVPLRQQRPPFWRINLPQRRILFSAYHTSPPNLPHYVAELRRRRPPWLHGYPSLLAAVAAYVLESGDDPGYRVRWVTTGAENLLAHQADSIEQAFGVRPRQHYGMAEAIANISQCPEGRLHVDEDFAAVEFLPGEGGAHRIVGTNFTNPATPLLRYEIQDLARLDDRGCGCGRPGRTVASVDGRLEDYVVLRNGARVGRMDHVFKDLVRVREAQIVQERPGELTVRIVRGPGYSGADEEALRRELRKRVGEDTQLEVEYHPALERSANGKLRFVVSRAGGGAIAS
jgi:phenylacetate-CoA ligase